MSPHIDDVSEEIVVDEVDDLVARHEVGQHEYGHQGANQQQVVETKPFGLMIGMKKASSVNFENARSEVGQPSQCH